LTGHLAPYAIARKFKEELQLVQEYGSDYGRNVYGELYCLQDGWRENYAAHLNAEGLRELLPPHAQIKAAYGDMLAVLRRGFDESNVRLLIGLLLDAFPRKPGESSAIFVDALILTIEEYRLPNRDDLAPPTAAIAHATQQAWLVLNFQPTISEFISLLRKSWTALLNDLGQLRQLGEFSSAIDEVIAFDEALPKSTPLAEGVTGDDDDIPF
jgi:hypothetical protein